MKTGKNLLLLAVLLAFHLSCKDKPADNLPREAYINSTGGVAMKTAPDAGGGGLSKADARASARTPRDWLHADSRTGHRLAALDDLSWDASRAHTRCAFRRHEAAGVPAGRHIHKWNTALAARA